MDTNDTSEPLEQTIVVKAEYFGADPALSEPNKPFLLGELPIFESLRLMNKKAKRITNSQYKYRAGAHALYYVEFLEGRQCTDRIEGRVGVTPRTVLVLYEVSISVAETFKAVPDWKFEKLSWSKYRELIQLKYESKIREKDDLVNRLTENWSRFYNLRFDMPTPKVIRFDARIGKHPRDHEFPSSDRFHWHVNLTSIKIADLFSAIEYFEQALFLMNVACDLTVNFDMIEVYCTPKGLSYEPEEK